MFEKTGVGSTGAGRDGRASNDILSVGRGHGNDGSSPPVESGKSWDDYVGAHDLDVFGGGYILKLSVVLVRDTNKMLLPMPPDL